MKRSILVFALAGLAALSMSCGGKQTAKTAGLTVRLLTDESGIDDRSFNAAAWRGILSSYGDNWDNPVEKGKLYDFVAVASPDMYLSTLRQASEEKRDLIIMTGDVWANALAEIAPKYPNQKYLIVDVNNIKAPNVMQIVFSEHEGAYLVGLAVGLKAQADGIKTPKFGFIGGQPGSVITKFEMGYIQGVKSVLPDATFLDYYANNWARPELAKIQAKNWYDNGVYAIFSAAGATGNGTIAQAKENRSQKKNVWAIGVDSDQFQDGIYSADSKSAVLTLDDQTRRDGFELRDRACQIREL